MDRTKYIGMDVHQEAITIAVMNSSGKLVMESIVETKAATIVQFLQGLQGDLQVTLEEGTWAAWLYDLLRPHVSQLIVCDPRKNALLKSGNKSDRIDARKLAELLRNGSLSAVYHGEKGLRTLQELSRSYLTVSKDLTRVMNRLKALYRSWGIACAGTQVYAPRHRSEWLSKITEAGVRCRAEFLYQQLDGLQALRQAVRRDLLAESRKHGATKLLRQIPSIGPIRAAVLIALLQTPHRFRTKRQLWAYSGLAIETRGSGEYRYVDGQLRRSQKPVALRGLNKNHNHDLKWIFKSAAMQASGSTGLLHEYYEGLLAKGMKPALARLTVARKIATITWIVWKKGARFDAEHLKLQAA
jgi:transposase